MLGMVVWCASLTLSINLWRRMATTFTPPNHKFYSFVAVISRMAVGNCSKCCLRIEERAVWESRGLLSETKCRLGVADCAAWAYNSCRLGDTRSLV